MGEQSEIEVTVDDKGDPLFEEIEVTLRTSYMGLVMLDATVQHGRRGFDRDASLGKTRFGRTAVGLSAYAGHVHGELQDIVGGPEEMAETMDFQGLHLDEDLFDELFAIVDVDDQRDDADL